MEGLTIEHKWWLKIEHVQWNSEVFAAPGPEKPQLEIPCSLEGLLDADRPVRRWSFDLESAANAGVTSPWTSRLRHLESYRTPRRIRDLATRMVYTATFSIPRLRRPRCVCGDCPVDYCYTDSTPYGRSLLCCVPHQ